METVTSCMFLLHHFFPSSWEQNRYLHMSLERPVSRTGSAQDEGGSEG